MVFVLVIIMSLFLRWNKCERGNTFIYFHSRLLGRENKIEFIFTTLFIGEKFFYLNTLYKTSI